MKLNMTTGPEVTVQLIRFYSRLYIGADGYSAVSITEQGLRRVGCLGRVVRGLPLDPLGRIQERITP